jgi:hypothetical protein
LRASYAHASAICPTPVDVTKFARIALFNRLKKRKYFSPVAQVQQSSHERSPTVLGPGRELRTKLSTAPVGNIFRSLS